MTYLSIVQSAQAGNKRLLFHLVARIYQVDCLHATYSNFYKVQTCCSPYDRPQLALRHVLRSFMSLFVPCFCALPKCCVKFLLLFLFTFTEFTCPQLNSFLTFFTIFRCTPQTFQKVEHKLGFYFEVEVQYDIHSICLELAQLKNHKGRQIPEKDGKVGSKKHPPIYWNFEISWKLRPLHTIIKPYSAMVGGRRGYFRQNRTWMCLPELKMWLSLNQFFAQLPTHQYTWFSIEKHPILPKLGAFWAPSLMKTNRSLYQILQKAPPKRQAHAYTQTMSI